MPVARNEWLPIAVPISAATARRRTIANALAWGRGVSLSRSEEHTSELQSLMRLSYAVFCLKKKIKTHETHIDAKIEYKSEKTLQYMISDHRVAKLNNTIDT